MASYADWINLMSYDLHGVWDRTDPIGRQVLAHTNLTEIDLALDLFWRAEVEPSSIVLGLAFYGRTFSLKSSSCWKPGCPFGGPGDAGQCTGTAGILSYREIQAILDETSATAYLDKEAVVRYLVYGNSSWVSFDDDITFQAKIDYANKIGLSGLMVWALDLDDSRLDALRAISGSEGLDGLESSFSLVDLKYLFPSEELPSADTKPSYGFVTFGSSGDLSEPNPSSGPFGFFLIASDSHVVTKLKKREGEPEPFVFLNCPSNVRDQPKDKIQTARVTCLSDDVEGCFRILERGVEGTIIEMPDNCASNSFARAISLELATDQSVPSNIGKRNPTSPVYNFYFDFNLGLMRRDTNNTRFRLDYSNVKGYWDHIVDAPGIQSRDLNKIETRFFAPTTEDWNSVFDKDDFDWSPQDATQIKQDVSAPIFWQSLDDCPIDGSSFGEGFGAFVQGNVDAQFWFGFSMIATFSNGKFDVDQAHGFLKASGQTDLTYGVGGIGDIDISKARKGNPAFSEENPVNLKGHTIDAASSGGIISLNPYYQFTYQMATLNGSNDNDFENSAVAFNGRLTTRIITDLGDFQAKFPLPENPEEDIDSAKRQKNRISIPSDDVLYGSSSNGGQIAIGTYLTFGLKMQFLVFGDLFRWTFDLPKMELVYNTMEIFSFSPGDKDHPGTACSDYEIITNVYQSVENSESLGWDSASNSVEAGLAYDRQKPDEGQVCYSDKTNSNKRATPPNVASGLARGSGSKDAFTSIYLPADEETQASPEDDIFRSRQATGSMSIGGWGYPAGAAIDPNLYFGADQGLGVFQGSNSKFSCVDCLDCNDDSENGDQCCGCVSMDYRYGLSDMPPCDICERRAGTWPGSGFLFERNLDSSDIGLDSRHITSEYDLSQPKRRVAGIATMTFKKITFCGEVIWNLKPYLYPSFPAYHDNPWDGIQNGQWDPISRYWGNSSSICQSWAVSNLQIADETYIPNSLGGYQKVRANYQTEHVFEGQLIGDFFTWWLDEGRLNSIDETVYYTQTKVPCSFTETFINDFQSNYPWEIKDKDGNLIRVSFAELLLSELGSEEHLDRLTIFLTRSNQRKGLVFQGGQIVSPKSYKGQSQQEQLLAVKEIGMIFNYLNTQDVWDKFCATYEAIYDHMGDFDTWYAQNGQGITIPSLQAEWKEFIRKALDSAVTRSRAAFDMMYNERRENSYFTPVFSLSWLFNKYWNRGSIRLTGICQNMDPSTIQ